MSARRLLRSGHTRGCQRWRPTARGGMLTRPHPVRCSGCTRAGTPTASAQSPLDLVRKDVPGGPDDKGGKAQDVRAGDDELVLAQEVVAPLPDLHVLATVDLGAELPLSPLEIEVAAPFLTVKPD